MNPTGYAPAMLMSESRRSLARRLTVGAMASASTLLLVGCGNSAATFMTVSNGVTVSLVATSDSSAIAALKSKLPIGGGVTTIHDGDDHVGNRICGFSTSKNGHSYQIDWYETGPLPNSSAAELCGTAAQQSFLSLAP